MACVWKTRDIYFCWDFDDQGIRIAVIKGGEGISTMTNKEISMVRSKLAMVINRELGPFEMEAMLMKFSIDVEGKLTFSIVQ